MGKISLEVNGRKVEKEATDNTLLSTFLREHLQLTGTPVSYTHLTLPTICSV